MRIAWRFPLFELLAWRACCPEAAQLPDQPIPFLVPCLAGAPDIPEKIRNYLIKHLNSHSPDDTEILSTLKTVFG